MKMIYRLKTNNTPRQKILITFLILVLIMAMVRFLFPNTWSSAVINGSRPFLKIGSGISHGMGRIFGMGGSGNSIENQKLKKQVEDLQLSLNDRNLLAIENNSLHEMLGRSDQRNLVMAVVLSKPILTPFDTFVIDQGSNSGIKKDDQVLAGTSTVIGIVSEVYSTISKVTANSSPGTKHNVLIGEKNIQAEAIGQGNGNFKIVLPEGTLVQPGDVIKVPDIIPTVFGAIEKIVPSDQPSFVNVLFKSPVNLGELYYVQVIR